MKDTSKSKLLQVFSEALDKNCLTKNDLINVLKMIFTHSEFFDDQMNRDNSLICDALDIKKLVAEFSGSQELCNTCETVTDAFIKGLVISKKFERASEALYETVFDKKLLKLMEN